MTNQIFLGVDLGAESGRVIAGEWDGRRIRLETVHRFPNEPVHLGHHLHWDAPRLWLEIQRGLTLAAKRFGPRIASVGVDTWGVDHVLLSKSNQLLGQPFHYRDGRTRGVLAQALARVPRADIFAASGLQFMEINSLYQLMALRRDHPELIAVADCFLMMPDYFHWCLSGERVAEFTAATTTQFFHPTKRSWSVELLRRFDLPVDIFPKVAFPGTRLGRLCTGVAERTGLDRVAVVLPASHDTGSAVAAVPTEHTGRANWAYISSGTWSLMGVELPQALLSPRALALDLTNEGGVDGTYRLLKNIMGLWLVQQCKRVFDEKGSLLDYSGLVRLAAAAPPLRSLVSPNDVRFLNPADMPGAIQQYCRDTGQPVPENEGALVRCILESLALMYQRVLMALQEVTGESIEVIHLVGGGSQNDLLNQFTANACELPVRAGPVEAAALGNVLVQARGGGEIASLTQLRDVVRASMEVREFAPHSASSVAWHEAKARFAALC